MALVFKIDNEKVSDYGTFLVEESDMLDHLYSDLLVICNEIEKNFITDDSAITIAKFREYISTFKKRNELLRKGGQILNGTASLYDNQEKLWANRVAQNELDKEVRS